MKRPVWAPDDVDINKPSIARVYDRLLGGFHNFEADRNAAAKITESVPNAPLMARAQREFLARVVRHYLDVGISQFLDLGSGLPSRGSTHEITQKYRPDARILYVDIDPIAVTHCRLILKGNDNAAALYADLREPATVLGAPETTRILDLDKPIGVLMIGVMHFIPDHDRPAGIIAGYHTRLASGSHFALTQGRDNDEVKRLAKSYQKEQVAQHPAVRSRADVETLFAGFELVVPGVTWIEAWKPEPNLLAPKNMPTKFGYAAVGRKS